MIVWKNNDLMEEKVQSLMLLIRKVSDTTNDGTCLSADYLIGKKMWSQTRLILKVFYM